MSERPRVLLIEDDASLQRFVQLALEDLDLELLTAGSVDEGLAELARAPVALIMTDLMLPGRSGFELVDSLAAQPALRAGARLAVFSAGLNPETRQRLAPPKVWRLLSKPCSLAELEACVRDALSEAGRETASSLAHPPAAGGMDGDQEAAIAQHFGGDAPLYHAFRASCLRQFRADMAEGERACSSADAAALRRLAHGLKSVLLTLGHAEASALAQDLEGASERADWGLAERLWRQLKGAIATLR
ncbi:response regulator [Roseateles sp. DAIF2]|uniref:response regulator n=1 Tax=Roseateles sp. DAIF2 TaxID=2714952 RepID=UPI0018A333AD|nr:response regulator [Roseateles sp. DAIF2]QPF74067.1 response regulator [Roseateles sp. DAIF2]